MVKKLKSEGYWVRGIDLKYPEYSETVADEFIVGDLREHSIVELYIKPPDSLGLVFDEIYQFAADMGGAGFVFTGENDAEISHSVEIMNGRQPSATAGK